MTALSEPAPAKVNLFLHILGRRPDGYHELESLTVFTEFGDRVAVAPADGYRLDLSGPFAAGLSEDNIVSRAVELMAAAVGRPPNVAVAVEKNIPVGAGLGGGSADAAAAIRALSRLWQVPVPSGLETLGADVPVCVTSGPSLMRGIGEIMEPMQSFPACAIVLVNPGVFVSTADVFRSLKLNNARTAPNMFSPDYKTLMGQLSETGNDLLPPAGKLAPEILDVLREIDGGELTGMSGSGATCFTVCADLVTAEAVADQVRRDHPDWWVVASPIRTAPVETSAG